MTVVPEVIVKTGAEGVYGAALPRLGLGLALKVEDGTGRAAAVALLALLAALGALPAPARSDLAELARPTASQPRPPDRRPDRAGARLAGS